MYGRIMAVTRSWIGETAEGEGFEPPGTCIPKLFKSFAFGRSAIPPESDIAYLTAAVKGICPSGFHAESPEKTPERRSKSFALRLIGSPIWGLNTVCFDTCPPTLGSYRRTSGAVAGEAGRSGHDAARTARRGRALAPKWLRLMSLPPEMNEHPPIVARILLYAVVESLHILLIEETQDVFLELTASLSRDDLDDRRLLGHGLVDDAA